MFAAQRQALQRLRSRGREADLDGLQAWLREARELGDVGLIAEGQFELAHLYRDLGQAVDAAVAAEQAGALAESILDMPLLFRSLTLQVMLMDDLGRTEDGLRLAERAMDLDWQPSPADEALAQSMAGVMMGRAHRVDEALRLLRGSFAVPGLTAAEQLDLHMVMIRQLCDAPFQPDEAAPEWQRLRERHPLATVRGRLRTAYWLTGLGVLSVNGSTGPLISTGQVLLRENQRHPHSGTGWGCAMALTALLRHGPLADAQHWCRLVEQAAVPFRAVDQRIWLLQRADMAKRLGDARSARRFRGRAGMFQTSQRAPDEVDARLVLSQVRSLEVRLALARSQQESLALRAELDLQETRLREKQELPPSLLSELFQLSGRKTQEMGDPDLGMLGFHLVFQPFLHIRDRRIVGCEALLRLNHPERGPMLPAEFIPRLDAAGEIETVGRWVLRDSCRQLRDWTRAGLDIAVAVNVTASQLSDEDFAVHVERLVDHFAIPPERLELEITETVACSESDHVNAALEHLTRLGLRVSVDDFGTGYSNFGRLLDIAPSKVKIDRSLVLRLSSGERAERAVQTLIQAAQGMAMVVTAEGIETAEQARQLAALGCDILQGYLIGRPQAAEALTGLLTVPAEHWRFLDPPLADGGKPPIALP